MKRRVEDLIENFGFYIDAFDNESVFSGPSWYFHLKTLERGQELGTVKAALFDSLFLDYLYARALLGCLRLRGLEQVAIHACLSFTAMLAVALAAVRGHEPGLMRSIKHFTA